VITHGNAPGYTYMGCPSEEGKTGTRSESDAGSSAYTPDVLNAFGSVTHSSREATGFGGPTAGRSGAPTWKRPGR